MATRYGTGSTRGRRQTDDTPLSDAPLDFGKGYAGPSTAGWAMRASKVKFKNTANAATAYDKKAAKVRQARQTQALRDSFGKALWSTKKVERAATFARNFGQESTHAQHTSQNAANHAARLHRAGAPKSAGEREAFSRAQAVDSRTWQDASNRKLGDTVAETKKVRNNAAAMGAAGGAAATAAGATAINHKKAPERRKMKVYKGDNSNIPDGAKKGSKLSKSIRWGAPPASKARTKAMEALKAKPNRHKAVESSLVAKTRSFDPEHRRQQKLGAATTVLGAGGGYAGYKGVSGIRNTTKAGRVVSDITTRVTGSSAQRATKNKQLLGAVRSGISGSKKSFALVGGGAAALGGAAGVQVHANSRRGKAWD